MAGNLTAAMRTRKSLILLVVLTVLVIFGGAVGRREPNDVGRSVDGSGSDAAPAGSRRPPGVDAPGAAYAAAAGASDAGAVGAGSDDGGQGEGDLAVLVPGEIDTTGDLGPEARAYFAELASRHQPSQAPTALVVRWVLEVSGEPVVDPEEVAAVAADAYADERGWGLNGAIRFERVDDAEEADFLLVVAEAATVPDYSEDCRSGQTGEADASCTVGDAVIINDLRWRDGALGNRIPLELFRIHEINHETGHWLGQGHFSCLGGVAAVNQQQFRSLDGCSPSAWPLPFERAMVAARFGVWPTLQGFEPYLLDESELAAPS